MNKEVITRIRQWAARRVLEMCGAALAFNCGVLSQLASGVVIPADRITDWTAGAHTGVPGGIPTNRTNIIDVTSAPYNADKTGATDASSAIQQAINGAKAGDIVYLPAGTFRLDTQLSFGASRDGITLRGAGMAATIIDCRTSSVGISVGLSSDYKWDWPSSGNTVAAGTVQKGQTQIPIADTSQFAPGQLVRLTFDDQLDETTIRAGAVPVVHVSSWRGTRGQIAHVVSKTASALTITPGVYQQLEANVGMRINVAQSQTDAVGIEDLTIDGSNGSVIFPISFEQCNGCWVKNVKSINTSNYHIYLFNSFNCEVRRCVLDGRKAAGTNGAGLLVNSTSACLFEDNIILRMFPAVEINQGSCGNVFAFNLFEDSRVYGTLGVCIDTNHGPHNAFNLYEGNVSPNFQSDGYFGSASEDTLFRNWFHGTVYDGSIKGFMASLNRFTRRYNVVGNIMGTVGTDPGSPYSFGNPNMGNANYTGTAQPSAGSFWNDWGAMKAAAPGAGPGASGFQEKDLDVETSAILKGNYHYAEGRIPDAQALGGDTIPQSLFRSSKPPWFGDRPWPPFDPLNPGTPAYDQIPAGYRFVHNTEVPGTDTATPPKPPSNLRIKSP